MSYSLSNQPEDRPLAYSSLDYPQSQPNVHHYSPYCRLEYENSSTSSKHASQQHPIVTQPHSGQDKRGIIEIQLTISNTIQIFKDIASSIKTQMEFFPVQKISQLPSGLQYLTDIDELLIKQKLHSTGYTGPIKPNKYTISNNTGGLMYNVKEEYDGCECVRECFGNKRAFDVQISDKYKNEVIRLHRDWSSSSCYCPCYLPKLKVYSPRTALIGTVEQTWSPFTPKFDIKDESGGTVLKIEGPIFMPGFCYCGDIDFNIFSPDKSREIGKITKKSGSLVQTCCTNAVNFRILFPFNLGARIKAVVIGACFLIVCIGFRYRRRTLQS